MPKTWPADTGEDSTFEVSYLLLVINGGRMANFWIHLFISAVIAVIRHFEMMEYFLKHRLRCLIPQALCHLT